ncbi:tRNA (N6-isopentenyl adenosine(37)-C2)-methylthiotransferase MiaB [Eubacteriaceae bacterium RF-744-FAT-4]|uniref:tRNA-2-methylthio-N(6)-dimethylallyladenosine synthase n=2 Tax=Pseudoramibacter porci TaxID=2606631 RepID=A0A7X2NFH5_9FIRM|nr:tRNA (N6-isopentenyl adenosine(37)-C2)-methylthiotransferase MiaB [Pseudoramibacter porci]
MNKTYKIITYGCQMNENDSEKISGMLKEMGYTPTDDEKNAGVVVMNTCSVRENADERFFGNVGNFKHIKKKNPDLILAVCGCMMQQPAIVKQIKEKNPQVDIVFGTHNIEHFPQLLEEFIETRRRTIEIYDDDQGLAENLPVDRKFPFKSYVSIMKGCNNFCTYCIVPYTRGREVSRPHEKIIEEITHLVEDGCLEVMLLGQNVNSYGNDRHDGYGFADLLRDVNQIEGLRRIRFMTSHPKDMSDAVIEAIATCEKVCPSIHLAIQSGSTRVLKAMHRGYTKEQIIALVQKIRDRIPHVSITTDIIVGFPGETEEDFEETLDVVKACQFDSAFSFIYSKRSGTPAAEMDNQISDEIKHQRINRLLDVLHQIGNDQNAWFKDQDVEVLVEGKSAHNPNKLSGRTKNGKLVNFSGDDQTIGTIIPVHIDRAKTFSLDGTAI